MTVGEKERGWGISSHMGRNGEWNWKVNDHRRRCRSSAKSAPIWRELSETDDISWNCTLSFWVNGRKKASLKLQWKIHLISIIHLYIISRGQFLQSLIAPPASLLCKIARQTPYISDTFSLRMGSMAGISWTKNDARRCCRAPEDGWDLPEARAAPSPPSAATLDAGEGGGGPSGREPPRPKTRTIA